MYSRPLLILSWWWRRIVQKDCLPLPCPYASLFRAANAFPVTWSERVFFSDTPPKCLQRDCVGRRRTLTRHGNVYLSVREKQGIVVYRQTCFTKSDISGCCFTSISRARPPENRNFWSPARSQIFAVEKISSPRERRKWSLSLGHNLKALGLTCVRSQSSREINNAIISEFSTFLKINKSLEQFHIRLTLFYPIYG